MIYFFYICSWVLSLVPVTLVVLALSGRYLHSYDCRANKSFCYADTLWVSISSTLNHFCLTVGLFLTPEVYKYPVIVLSWSVLLGVVSNLSYTYLSTLSQDTSKLYLECVSRRNKYLLLRGRIKYLKKLKADRR